MTMTLAVSKWTSLMNRRTNNMSENNPLTELQDLLYKIKNRTQRIQESTQNPSQASLDALYSDVVDAYWALNSYKQEQEKLTTPPPNS